MTVLVAAASKHGATDEIAERIGANLADRGLTVEVKKLQDVDDLKRDEAVVLGSAIFYGRWMKEAIRFVDAHAKMARCREGDWRDFETVDDWAAAIAHELDGHSAS
jgi:menaquinone-dependent protoporphyrinogen oxidase